MNHLSFTSLTDDQFQRWAEARKSLYRSVLRDPRSSDHAKSVARAKLKATEPPVR